MPPRHKREWLRYDSEPLSPFHKVLQRHDSDKYCNQRRRGIHHGELIQETGNIFALHSASKATNTPQSQSKTFQVQPATSNRVKRSFKKDKFVGELRPKFTQHSSYHFTDDRIANEQMDFEETMPRLYSHKTKEAKNEWSENSAGITLTTSQKETRATNNKNIFMVTYQ